MTTTPTPTLTRRTALLSSVSGLLVALAGCSDDTTDTTPDNGSSSAGPLTSVAVDGTELVVEFDPDAGATALSVVDPTGESVAHRDLPAGVQRESVELGTAYEPGVFDVLLLDDGEEIASVEHEIRPELALTDLKLGRNHPEEMYEGAGDLETDAEVILSLENRGSGPIEISNVRFTGDVPQPTPEDHDGAGFHIPERDDDGEGPVVFRESAITAYSNSRPFSPTGANVDCTDDEVHGEFEVSIETGPGDDFVASYSATYRPSENACDVVIERGEGS